MPISTHTQAVRKINDGAARAVPDVLPSRFIFTQDQFPAISDFIPAEAMPEIGPGQPTIQIPGKIATRKTHQIQPKAYDFGVRQTEFEANAIQTSWTAGSTSNLTLVSTSGLKPYSLLKNRTTLAVYQVASVTSGTVVTAYPIAIGQGDGTPGDATAAALADVAVGEKFDFLGSAYPDGATLQTPYYVEPTERSNYMQFHVDEVEIGMLAKARQLFPDNENGYGMDMKTAAIHHNEGRERAFLFGESSLATVNGELIHTMLGLEGWCTTEHDAGGSITMDEWRTVIMPKVAEYGGQGTFKSVTGNAVMSAFDGLLEAKIETGMDQRTMGPLARTIRSSLGDVLLRGSQPMNERSGEIFIYRPETAIRMVLDGFDMKLYQDLAPNNILKDTGAWMTCETVIFHNPENITKVINVA